MPKNKDSEKDHITLTRDQWKGKLFRYMEKRRERRRKFISTLLIRLSVVAGIGLSVFLVSLYALPGSAYVSSIYSTTCLGGWENPQNAQGEPSVTKDGGRYSSANSAVLMNRVAEIFCGGFSREGLGHIEPTEITLNFSLFVREPDENILHIQDDEYEARTEEILDAPKDVEVKFELTEPTDDPEILPDDVVDEPSEGGTEVEPGQEETVPANGEGGGTEEEGPSVETPPDSSPSTEEAPAATSGFFQRVITLLTPEVRAQDEALLEPEDGGEKVEEVQETVTLTTDELVEVHYTIDGGTWIKLGVIQRDTWEFATFKLPLEVWENLENLQIRMRSISSFDEKPSIYLDALWLEVTHEKKLPNLSEENLEGFEDFERVKGNFLRSLTPDKKSFGPEDTLEFEFVLPASTETEPAAGSTPAETSETPASEADSQSSDTEPAPESVLEPASDSETVVPEESILEPEEVPVEEVVEPVSFRERVRRLLSYIIPEVYAQAPNGRPVSAKIYGPLGDRLNIRPVIAESNGSVRISIPKSNAFTPGKHRMEVEVVENGKVFISEREFLWGVLALNLNKSVYAPQEEAYFQMAALTDMGDTMCDAELELRVTSPSGKVVRATNGEGGDIINSPTCGNNNVTDDPDYFLYQGFSEIGTYTATLTNLENDYTVDTTFRVARESSFDVERRGATRINPFRAAYTMNIFVVAKEDVRATIVERVPRNFEIEPHDDYSVERRSDEKLIVWKRELTAGEKIHLTYTYEAPRISPQFYLLGALTIQKSQNFFERTFNLGGDVLFKESREWHIASDAVVTQGATTAVSASWVNSNNALGVANDNLYATETRSKNSAVSFDEFGDYGFDSVIPVGSTIDAVELLPEWYINDCSKGMVASVQAFVGGAGLTLNGLGCQSTESTTTVNITGQRSWTRTDLLDANFKVRMAADGTGIIGGPSATYIIYLDRLPVRVTYTPPDSATVSTFGTQATAAFLPGTNQEIGGGFAITETASGSRNVTSVMIRETGTIDAATNIANVKLFYEMDTTAPYDCAGVTYDGTEPQYGSTVAGGFNSADGYATFTGSVGISTTSTLCLHPVLDVTGGSVGQTIELSINNPSTDVVVSGVGATVAPNTAVAIPGTTTLEQAPAVIDISGNLYHTGSESTLNTIAVTVALSINNAPPTTLTMRTGSYSFTNVSLFEGDTIAVYLSGSFTDANTFTVAGANNITGLNLYLGAIGLYDHGGSGITNSQICGQSTYPEASFALFSCSGNDITYSGVSGTDVHIAGLYVPGANVTTSTWVHLATGGTYSGGNETLHIQGYGNNTLRRPLYIDGGTFTAPTLTRFTGDAANIDAATYNNLELKPLGSVTHTLGTGTGQTFTINGNLVINHDTGATPTVTANTYDPTIVLGGDLTISASSTFEASNSSALTIEGNYTNNGTFSANGGNVSFTSTANQTLAGSMTGTSAFNNILFSGVGGAGTWTTSYETPDSVVYSFALDSTNNILYAGTGLNYGVIYRCATSTGCDASTDWTVSYDTTETRIQSLTIDSTNGVLYAGTSLGGIIYRCATSTGCDAAGDWTTSYDTAQTSISELTFDSTNGVLYAGADGIIYRCATSTGCDASTDWTVSYDTAQTSISSLTFDSTNGVLYAGTYQNGIIYRCATSTGCDASTDWTVSYDTTGTRIFSFTIDTTNNVLYASSDNLGGTIYRCATSTGCDAAGDWTAAFLSVGSGFNIALTFDSVNNVLYASGDGGIIYSCSTSTGCDASGDWSVSYDSTETDIFAFAFDSTDGVLYAGTYPNGIIYRLETSSSKTFTANAETNNFTISSGNVTFPSGTLTVKGNFTDTGGVGTFTHNSGNVTLAGTSQQTIQTLGSFNGLTITNNSGTDPVTSPSVIFGTGINATTFTATTANTKLRFNAGSTYSLTNINLNGQATGTRLTLRSSTTSTPWLLNVTGTQTVLNVDAQDSNASGGNTIVATDLSNVNSGGNTNWSFPQIVDVSGNIYDGGVLNTTPLDISISVNNGAPTTLIDQTGSYSFTSVPAGPGDTLAVYVNGEVVNATTLTRTGAVAITDLHLYLSTFTVRSHNGSSITNANICAQSTYPGVGDTLVTCSATVPTFSDTLRLGATYAPGGNVNASKMHVVTGGTYSGASEILTLTGSGTGVSRPLYVDGGVFTAPLTVRHTGTLATAIQTGVTYQALEVLPVSGSPVYSLSGGNFISTDFTLGNGVNAVTLNAALGDDIFYNNVTISTNATYSSTDWTEITGNYTNNGTVDFGLATVTFNGTANQTLSGNMTGTSAFNNVSFSGGGGVSSWTTSYDTPESDIFSLTLDSTNGVLYAGSGFGGIIYRCATSTGCDASGDWTVSYDTAQFEIKSLTFDSTNNVLYAGATGGIIYRCATSTGCDAAGDWTVSYDTPEDDILSFTLDSTNGVLYAAGGYFNDQTFVHSGTIYRCATSTGCDASSDWTISYSISDSLAASLTLDSTNGVLYAGSGAGSGGTIYRCATSTGCDAGTDWTTSYDTLHTSIHSLSFDPTSAVLYASTGDSVGTTYRCDTSTNCDAAGDWVQGYEFQDFNIFSLVVDSTNGVLYAGGDGGNVYACNTSTLCNTQSNWTTVYFSSQSSIRSLALDSTNGVVYAGSGTNGIIYRFDTNATSKTFTANAETNNFTISSGSVTFPSGTLTVNGNYTNSGTVDHNSGSVLFAGTQQTLSGSMTGSSAFNSVSFFGGGGASWGTSYDTTEAYILSSALDTTNGVLYAGSGTTNGIIYRCATSTGCDAAGDWTVSYDTPEASIWSLTVDTTNGVLYAGSGSGGIIYRCATSTGCDASGDWTVSYDTPETSIYSLTLDTTNGVLYAGSGSTNGIIYRCATSTGCDAAGDWTVSYDTPVTEIRSTIVDATNGVLYAGSTNGIIYRCATSTGCDAAGDWTVSYDTPESHIRSFALDTTNGVLYAGTSSGGIIYRCETSTGCDAAGDWSVSYDTPELIIFTLTFDSSEGVLYAGSGSSGIIYRYAASYSTKSFASGIDATSFTATSAYTELNFNAGSTYNLTNINFNGQAMGTPLTLRSSIASTAWLLNVTGTQTVLNVDVQDSNASGGNTIDATNGSNVDSGGNTNWSFPSAGAITFSISDNSVGFGALTASAPRFCSADGNGSGSEIEAHTLSASTDFSGGYSIAVRGATLTNEFSDTVQAIGGVSEASSVGTEQFGLRLNATGGSGVVSAPYGTTGEFAYGATESVSDEVASSPGISTQTVYSVRYLGNVAPTTPAGSYTTNLTYVITSNF